MQSLCLLVELFVILIIVKKDCVGKSIDSVSTIHLNRAKRYLGLNKQYKVARVERCFNCNKDGDYYNAKKTKFNQLHQFRQNSYQLRIQAFTSINKRYQECVAPGDVPGHCKHFVYCPMNTLKVSRGSPEYLCVIENTHVGICCPDDIVLSSVSGSRIVMDLPAGGYDQDDNADGSSPTTGCGITAELSLHADKSTKQSKQREWPWLAALYRVDGTQLPFCGGAVITDQHILTAAHCISSMHKDNLRVRLGEYDVQKPNETRARDFAVKEIIIHKEFESATYFNDIAILTLEKPTNFDTYVWPICLPPVNSTYVNKTVIVAGWGQQYYAGPTSQILMEVAVPVWEHEKCVEAFVQRITENNLCAAAYEGGKDACLGDSGGPLLYKLDNGRWVTIGIVSWGIGCGNKDQPGIYTRVDKYIPWIIMNTITKQLIYLPN